ncbi:MAG TPA: hypothetical protein VIV57_26900, partial [Anaeromyxobacter sp.]
MGRVRAGTPRRFTAGEVLWHGACAAPLAAALAAVGCSGGSPQQPANVGYGLVLQGTGGIYDDGSGILGLAVLSTLRDSGGAGPSTAWDVALRDETGALPTGVAYGPGPAGSYQAWWWPAIPPRPGPYSLTVSSDGGRSLEAGFSVAAASGLARPDVAVSMDGSLLSWAAIPWAASWECRVFGAGVLRYLCAGPEPACDVSAIEPGAYEVSVLALSADLGGLASSGAQQPLLPARFDVSETRVAFVRPQPGAPAMKAAAAGGALRYGNVEAGLAIWLSLAQADGSATPVAWTVTVTGPGLPPYAPLTFTYAAGQARALFWSYDVPATPGSYAVAAESTAASVVASFTVGQPAVLDPPVGVTAAAEVSGGATVDWTPVAGARSTFVGVWTQATPSAASTFVDGLWVSGPPARFPSGTFAAGSAYEVYVAATDADMVGASAPPAQVAVSENTFFPAS